MMTAESAPANQSHAGERYQMASTTLNPAWRVMVVDDDEVNLILAMEVLALFGVQAWTWHDPLAAYEAFQRDPVDLVFLDVHMPGMDGLEMADRIRTLEQRTGRRRTPIVALTASALPDEQAQCLAHGMDEVVLKPFAFETMRAAVHRWCKAPV
jgi:CheY-like chemotaxis protein